MADGGDSHSLSPEFQQVYARSQSDRGDVCVHLWHNYSFVGVFSFVYINILYDFYGVVKETGLAE